jgi:DNA-binding LytR/AlgR family response regulator
MAIQKKLMTEPLLPMTVSHINTSSEVTELKGAPDNSDEKSNRTEENSVQPPPLINFLWHEVEKLVDVGMSKKTKPKIVGPIFIRVKDQIISINLSEVLWVEAYGDYVNFFTEKTRYIVHSTMKAVEAKLPNDAFARVHRSFIIRIDKIELIEESQIQIGKKLVPIGESYRNEFISKLNIL